MEVDAAKAAYVDRFVHTLPDGYDTQVSDGGANISVGERQLITIARAVLAQPQLLILDEATSAVDTHTELLIQEALRRLMRQRTTLVIAHRLSTVRHADCIIVLDQGRIVERGRHEDLLAAAMNCAEGVIDSITARRFWPPAERMDWDDFETILLGDPGRAIDPVNLIQPQNAILP